MQHFGAKSTGLFRVCTKNRQFMSANLSQHAPSPKALSLSLKARLGLGALLLGLVTLVTAGMMVVAMDRVTQRLDAALMAEKRVERYAALSTQVSTFIVIAAESIQTRMPPDDRALRLESVTSNIMRTLTQIRQDLDNAVLEARALGIDEQSRRATQSLGIARMEAMFTSTRDGFLSDTQDPDRLQGFLDIFSISFDPLLNEVVVEEMRARQTILSGIETLRQRLTLIAAAVAAVTIVLLLAYYFALIRPQFRRLDMLRDAAQRIGREDFAVALPDNKTDEIGRVFSETNRMAAALSDRKAEVASEWAKLNDIIADRTQELSDANAKLAKTDEDRRRFFADVSHELRTPLTVILMESQLGRAGGPDPQAAFATIESRALRLNRRIDDLLRVARSESGQLALNPAPFDLPQMIDEALDETRAEIANAGMEMTLHTIPDLTVEGDRNWIRQVIASLIRNAIRHAADGTHLSLGAEATDTTALIHITDNGPGIAPADQGKIFERFAQGSGTTRAAGFGVGLALAKWVIEEQGGQITIHSPLPRDTALGDNPGTTVTLSLPLAI
ncbi:hypothetical protein SAMN04488045_3480 [Thalassococcus halodurans]|uniref:histidine kinase n=2 Tax=Thalassococcus halodurans TaxID=373675 RepID=A0A1H6BE57_9RHOB|nr:hypothetical protein SAMN04488045_3480 [Thalassococcus halodurans]